MTVSSARPSRRCRLVVALAAPVLAATATLGLPTGAVAEPSAARSSVPLPAIEPAPAGIPQTSLASLTAPAGYEESEYFVSGVADTYRERGEWGIDGRWDKEVAEEDTPYATRVLVQRPTDPRRFNGTVWVEWLNVSTGRDVAPSFIQARDRILASGAAWVGVSAQRVGVEAAKAADPRYASLEIARDALSYDIWSQVGRAVRERPAELLGGLRPRRLIAAGESQSAFRMTTYVNAFHRTDRVYDGFLIHSRFAAAAPLAADGFFGAPAARLRTDVGVPVLTLQTESDLAGWEQVRQPDRGHLHTWEVAGSAHVDVYTIEAQLGRESDGAEVGQLLGCALPVNDFPFRYAANAAYAALERWVRFGLRPRAAPPLQIVDDVIQRDADGNARGGLRLPDIDVPVASHTGLGNSDLSGTSFLCSLFGNSTEFTPERLSELYPSKRRYVLAYAARAAVAVLRGFMTPADARRAVARARSAGPTLG